MSEIRIAIVMPDGEVWSICEWDEAAAPDWRPPLPEQRIVRNPPDFVGVGWRYSKESETWTPLVAPRQSVIPLAAFLDRFTEDESLAIITAEQTNARVRLWKERVLAAPSVNLDDARVRAGLDLLRDLSILTADRIAAIVR